MSVPASAKNWANLISCAWRKGAEAILETGRLLQEAKGALEHGKWLSMVETSLPFKASTAQRLMAIAADPWLSNPAHVQHLPPHWGTLYEMTKVDSVRKDEMVRGGILHPEMERKAVPSGSRAIMSSRLEPDDSLDYFCTPPWATRALMEHVFPRVGFLRTWKIDSTAWEPACGEGHIAEVLGEYFGHVVATDIHDYGYGAAGADFLSEGQVDVYGFDWIITNPPFNDKTEGFVLRALERARVGVAMFVRLQWLESVGRYEAIFRDYPPTVIAFFAERVNLCKGRWDPEGSTATAYIWLVWIKGRKPQAPFWIPPGQREALTRPNDVARFTARPVIKRVSLPPHDPETGEILAQDAVAPTPDASLGRPAPVMETAGAGTSPPEIDPYEIPDWLRRVNPPA